MTPTLPLSPLDYAVTMLMSRGKVPWRATVKPEERLCIEFADEMRKRTVSGRYKGIWTHLPLEGKRHPLTALIMKAMGMITGAPDYALMWKNGNGLIEFKAGKGRQTEYQAYFQLWAEESQVSYALCRSVDEALRTLDAWGAFA